MLKNKTQIKLFVLSCVLVCHIYGNIIQVEVVVLCLLVVLYSNHQIGENESG